MNLSMNSLRVPVLAACALFSPAFAARATDNQVELQKEGVQLIRQVEEAARGVRYESGRLNSFTRTTAISRWTHYHHLSQIKSIVNDGLRPALVRLEQLQGFLPEWKQQSINQMIGAAQALAADTNDAILNKNELSNVPPALNEEYKSMMSRVYVHADALVKTADAAGTYATARLKAAEVGVRVPSK